MSCFPLSFWCLVTAIVLWLFLALSRVGLQCAIVVFPGHTHLLFTIVSTLICVCKQRTTSIPICARLSKSTLLLYNLARQYFRNVSNYLKKQQQNTNKHLFLIYTLGSYKKRFSFDISVPRMLSVGRAYFQCNSPVENQNDPELDFQVFS